MPNEQVVGQIALKMVLDDTDYKRSLSSAEKRADTASTNMAASFKKVGAAIAKAFTVAAVIKFGKDSVESAAKVQASNAQLAQTFGDLQAKAEAAMQAVADRSGVLKTRLQGVGTDIFAFAKTSGMDSAAALGMMQEALQVTADSAAYYDRSLEDTAESLKSFLKGNYANDAALGLSCTETTRNAAANRLYGKSFKDLSEAQKQLTLLQMVKDANQLSGAMGQAARESNGWENVLGNLKESWNQLLAAVGKPILQGAVVVIQHITSAIQGLTKYAQMASNALSGLFGFAAADTAPAAAVAEAAQQTAASIGESADNQEELTKETQKTDEAAKGGLASFDKLNVLTQNKGGGGSGSASASGGSPASASAAQSAGGMANSVKTAFSGLFEKSGFKSFLSIYNGKVKIESVMMNLPSDADCREANDEGISSYTSLRSAMVGNIPETPVFKLRTGQKFGIADAVIEVFYTQEDFVTKTRTIGSVKNNWNNSSLIFSVDIAGQRIMIPGDSQEIPNNLTAEVFGAALKSDILQVCHHGGIGGTNSFYACVDPAVALYTTSDVLVPVYIATFQYNDYLVNRLHVVEYWNAQDRITEFPLPYTPAGSGFRK